MKFFYTLFVGKSSYFYLFVCTLQNSIKSLFLNNFSFLKVIAILAIFSNMAFAWEADCKKICTSEYKPICGKKKTGVFNTFSNTCAMDNVNCNLIISKIFIL